MPAVRVYTREGNANGLTATQGTKVLVGDTTIDMVTELNLVADADGVWTLKISVVVDPAKLFLPLPASDQRKAA